MNERPQTQFGSPHSFETGSGRTRLRLSWLWHGQDLHLHIGGGADHIGAVALAGRQPDGQAFAESLRQPPHREAELALLAASRLHAALGRAVCVTAGVHLDAITPDEIRDVLATAEEGVRELIVRLTSEFGRSDETCARRV